MSDEWSIYYKVYMSLQLCSITDDGKCIFFCISVQQKSALFTGILALECGKDELRTPEFLEARTAKKI